MSASGNWRIDESGKLVVEEIKTKKLEVGSPEQPEGVTLYSPSGSPYCVHVADEGAVISTSGICVPVNQNNQSELLSNETASDTPAN